MMELLKAHEMVLLLAQPMVHLKDQLTEMNWDWSTDFRSVTYSELMTVHY